MQIFCSDSNGDVVEHFTQWDKNQSIFLTNWEHTSAPAFWFYNTNNKQRIFKNSGSFFGGNMIKVAVPDELLSEPYDIYCEIKLDTATSSNETVYNVIIPIYPKLKASNEIYNEQSKEGGK